MTNPTFGGSSAPSEVRLSALGEAWAMVQQQMGTWIVTAIIYLVVSLILNAISGIFGPRVVDGQVSGGVPILAFLLRIVTLVVVSIMLSGMYRMALKQLRGQSISPGDIFSATDVLPAVVGASILSSIAIGIGTLLCIIPGIILAGLLMLTTPIIVDQRVGAIAGLTMSLNALKPHMISALIFIIVLGLIVLVSMIPCGLGLLVTLPMSVLAGAIIYRDFFDNGNAVADDSAMYPPIPNVPQ